MAILKPGSWSWSGRKKTACGVCGRVQKTFYDRKPRCVRDLSCGDTRVYLVVEFRRLACGSCGLVKQEKLAWIADNPLYTKRFAFFVGRRCRASALKDVAQELHLDWQTVKGLEMQYMREQLRRAGMPGPLVIGIDEISVKHGQDYRIVVSDLLRRRAIWFGGKDRKEESMDPFYQELGAAKSSRIRLAVMDMWKAFQKSATKNAPQADILFDKFHVMQHLTGAGRSTEKRIRPA